MVVYDNVTELIGRTPLVELHRFAAELPARLVGKLESANPGGSVKDRIALAMIEAAEKSGALAPGGTIIEATSGNTGIGLAMVAAERGYGAVFTMPDGMSVERRRIITAYGARIVLTPAAEGMPGALEIARRLAADNGWFMPRQFENPVNPDAHRRATAREIWNDLKGGLDAFVAGVGTGGTLTGVGKDLKRRKPSIHVVAVEPDESPVLSGGAPGPHRIQGIGPGFVPAVLDPAAFDEVMRITGTEAAEAARRLAKTEGILAGISSGAALCAASQVAKREEMADKTIVVLLPDTGERYLSTGLFDDLFGTSSA
ncbi:MAG: cysteine synthase A [Acidimicrobiales bacterium]|jgi:cysteine synthase A